MTPVATGREDAPGSPGGAPARGDAPAGGDSPARGDSPAGGDARSQGDSPAGGDARARSRRAWALDAGIVALAKVAAIGVVLAAGLGAVSDDDFARVVIAQEWAHAPRLDPSGTSWLPAPFWVLGLAMRVVGRGLDIARAVSAVLGVASAIVVYTAARWITTDRRGALAGALVAAIFPWSAILGAATVPELPAASLALLAAASLVPDRSALAPRPESAPSHLRMLAGGAALAGSTLSRYEAWPIAAIFAGIALSYAAREPLSSPPRARPARVLAAALALAGPVAWMIWNRIAHGSALHFLERVAAYRKALGGGDSSAPLAFFAYPAALVRHEPELIGVLLILGILYAGAPGLRPPSLSARLRRYARPAALMLAQIVLLSAAMVKDGAPTHHPERALLSVMLLLAIAAGDFGLDVARRAPARSRVVLTAALLAWLVPAAIYFRPWLRREHLARRDDEIAIGRATAALVPPGERVLVEVTDYGYFAIMAAFARPEDTVIDRALDPRRGVERSSFEDPAALSRRLAESGAPWFIARATQAALTPLHADADAVRGAFRLFRAASVTSAPLTEGAAPATTPATDRRGPPTVAGGPER